jgi:hypothetical protein
MFLLARMMKCSRAAFNQQLSSLLKGLRALLHAPLWRAAAFF